MRLVRTGLEALGAARGQLLPWAPFWLALGIGPYFALKAEPGWPVLGGTAVLALGLALIGLRGHEIWRAPALGLALVAGGLLLAAVRAHSVAAPVLPFRYYGPIEGRIVDIDRSFSDELRLTLDRVVLEDTAPERTPARVRVALHGEQGYTDLLPGLTVILSGHLAPPEGPVEPGGFDFQRLAWFSGLGAVGYTRSPVLALEPPEGEVALFAFRLRMRLSAAMQAAIPGQSGAFAASLMTGDRSALTQETNDLLRASNLSHLISISGLHMSLLAGIIFAAIRYGLALAPALALRLNAKKLAALVALGASAFYLMLAGSNAATNRSFVMVAVMLVAVLADRRAISLRSVAIAALIVLVAEPESLIEPGFQMSFGATVALIVAFQPWQRVQERVPVWARPVAVAVLSSLAAGLATGPIAAAHFNRVAEYGLLANLLAVPIMGFIVMPAGVAAALLSPFGLAWVALKVMGVGTALILAIGDWITGLDGAVAAVAAPPPGALAVLGAGGYVLLVGRAAWLRGAGGLAAALALVAWTEAERPLALVSGDGGMTGVLGPEGRALSKAKGAAFVAKSWLEDDGDMAVQEAAFARPGFSGAKGDMTAEVAGVTLRHLFGKGAATRAHAACTGGAIVVSSVDWEGAAPADCTLFDPAKLKATGALALYAGKDGLRIVAAREMAGRRLWNRPAARGPAPDRDHAVEPQLAEVQ